MTAMRIAVCMGTENATPSAHSTRAGSQGSTDTSTARTSWPSALSAAAGEATCTGWWPELVGRDQQDAHAGTLQRARPATDRGPLRGAWPLSWDLQTFPEDTS